jgi:type I thyroxine 5'-deiodinase
MQSNVKEGVLFRNPTTYAEREQVANSCVRKLHVAFPALIDSTDNQVEKAYTGWPDRLYLVGADGSVRFKSAAGPFGFLPKTLEAALAAQVPYTVAVARHCIREYRAPALV